MREFDFAFLCTQNFEDLVKALSSIRICDTCNKHVHDWDVLDSHQRRELLDRLSAGEKLCISRTPDDDPSSDKPGVRRLTGDVVPLRPGVPWSDDVGEDDESEEDEEPEPLSP